jgi:hypothetical protein
MMLDKLVRIAQFAGAVLAIPVAATGTVSVYRSYFSSEVGCQNLRGVILGTIDKNVPPQAKLTLLRKDVQEFEKNCATVDPDAHAIFRSTMAQLAARAKQVEAGATRAAQPVNRPAPAELNSAPAAPATGTVAAANAPPPLFEPSMGAETRAWVAIIRGDKGHEGELNFDGFAMSHASLPPAGTVLSAKRMLMVWPEPKFDPGKVQARLKPGSCVRVLSTRAGPVGAWAEVTPAPCT